MIGKHTAAQSGMSTVSKIKDKRSSDRLVRLRVYGWVLAVTGAMLILMFVSRGIYPFGDNVLVYADGDQNFGFTSYLQNTFFTEDNLLCSWSSVLGGNPLGSITFYAGSVFNLLTVLFPFQRIDFAKEATSAGDGTECRIQFRTDKAEPVYTYVPEGDYRADFPLPSRRQDTFWVGNFAAGEEGELILRSGASYAGEASIGICTEEIEVLAVKAAAVQSQAVAVEVLDSSHLRLACTVRGNRLLASSIPFDDDCHVSIDGTEVKTFRNMNWFLAFSVPAGTHQIELVYRPPYMQTGAAVSAASLAALFICIYRKKLFAWLLRRSPDTKRSAGQ